MRANENERHVCGAEGICSEERVYGYANMFIQRALTHVSGKPDEINLSIERLKEQPLLIKSLPVWTCKSEGISDSEKNVGFLLEKAGFTRHIIDLAKDIVFKQGGMAGACFLDGKSGTRLEPNTSSGIRVTRVGINNDANLILEKILNEKGLTHYRTKEALILASKIASFKGIKCELCVSDDPDYTTGYVASRQFGYIRIPMIKSSGSYVGGRVFFVEEGVDVTELVYYLEKVPVLISEISEQVNFGDIDEIKSAINS